MQKRGLKEKIIMEFKNQKKTKTKNHQVDISTYNNNIVV